MYPATFDYRRAASLDEALSLLGQNPDAKLLAGGHSLLPMMKLRLAQPAMLVDIGRLPELRGVTEADGGVRIGATTTHAEIAGSAVLARRCPILAEAASEIADPQVRHRGTLGGNLAHADPASDLPAVLVACGATVVVAGAGGERRVAAGDFFVDLLETAMEEREILLAVEIPDAPPGTGSCYLKHEHPASGYALCGAAAVVTISGGAVSAASLAFNGVSATPHAASAACAALVGGSGDEASVAAALETHLAIDDPLGDVQASGEYRVQLARTYGRRALAEARKRAQA